MACDDPQDFTFEPIPGGATYELKVDAPDGSVANARFDEEGDPAQTWTDIAPGPHRQTLTGAGELHLVFVRLVNVAQTPVTMTVQASVTGIAPSFCRKTTLAAGTAEEIKHRLVMA